MPHCGPNTNTSTIRCEMILVRTNLPKTHGPTGSVLGTPSPIPAGPLFSRMEEARESVRLCCVCGVRASCMECHLSLRIKQICGVALMPPNKFAIRIREFPSARWHCSLGHGRRPRSFAFIRGRMNGLASDGLLAAGRCLGARYPSSCRRSSGGWIESDTARLPRACKRQAGFRSCCVCNQGALWKKHTLSFERIFPKCVSMLAACRSLAWPTSGARRANKFSSDGASGGRSNVIRLSSIDQPGRKPSPPWAIRSIARN